MQKRRSLYIVVALLLLSGCQLGASKIQSFQAAGSSAEFQLQSGIRIPELGRRMNKRFSHELLAMDDRGLLVLIDGKIVMVEYRALFSYRVRSNKRYFRKVYPAETIQSKIMQLADGNLALLARFPQGVSPALLEELLAAHDQVSLIIVTR